MEKNWFIIGIVLIILIMLIFTSLICFVFYVPEGVFMITGYNDKNENGEVHYIVKGFNYSKEEKEIYEVNKESYKMILTNKRNFYKVYKKGLLGNKKFMIEINDDEAHNN